MAQRKISFGTETESLHKLTPNNASSLNSEANAPKDERVNVGIKLKVELNKVDDITERIRYNIYVCLHYKDPNSQKFLTDDVKGPFALVPYENSGILLPNLDFLNQVKLEHIEGFRFLISKSDNTVFLYRRYRLETEQILNIYEFPYDRQVLSIPIRCYNAKLVNWTETGSVPAGIENDPRWAHNDFVIECHGRSWVLDWAKHVLDNEKTPSIFTCKIGVSRSPLFYLQTFVSVIFVVVLAIASIHAIDPTDFASRAGITFTALLTVIAFKYAIMNGVPPKEYVTYLDTYVLVALITLLGVILENYCVSQLKDTDYADVVDYYFTIVLLICWVVTHLMIAVGSSLNWFYLSWDSVEKRESELDKHAQSVVDNTGSQQL